MSTKCTNMPASFIIKFSIPKDLIPSNTTYRFSFLTSQIPLFIVSMVIVGNS